MYPSDPSPSAGSQQKHQLPFERASVQPRPPEYWQGRGAYGGPPPLQPYWTGLEHIPKRQRVPPHEAYPRPEPPPMPYIGQAGPALPGPTPPVPGFPPPAIGAMHPLSHRALEPTPSVTPSPYWSRAAGPYPPPSVTERRVPPSFLDPQHPSAFRSQSFPRDTLHRPAVMHYPRAAIHRASDSDDMAGKEGVSSLPASTPDVKDDGSQTSPVFPEAPQRRSRPSRWKKYRQRVGYNVEVLSGLIPKVFYSPTIQNAILEGDYAGEDHTSDGMSPHGGSTRFPSSVPSAETVRLEGEDSNRSKSPGDNDQRKLESIERAFAAYYENSDDQAGAEAFARKSQADVLTATLAYSVYLQLYSSAKDAGKASSAKPQVNRLF